MPDNIFLKKLKRLKYMLIKRLLKVNNKYIKKEDKLIKKENNTSVKKDHKLKIILETNMQK
jgi:hypothetical protein